MRDEIERIVTAYKGVGSCKVELFDGGEYVGIACPTIRYWQRPLAAVKILNRFSDVRMVHFTGGFLEDVYTRSTLRWGGYKVKQC